MPVLNVKKVKCLTFLLPILIFFLLSSFPDSDYFNEQGILKLVIGFISYTIAFYISYDFFLAKIKQDSHFISHTIVYVPLCVFLLSGSYALYKGSLEFLDDERGLYKNSVISEARQLAADYIENCQKNLPNEMHEQCIGRYLTNNLSSDVANLKARHDDLSNGYSVIAIITGFFGVLMTVLVIYFSISSKEEIVRRVTAAEEKIEESKTKLKEEIDKKIQEVEEEIAGAKRIADASTELTEELAKKIVGLNEQQGLFGGLRDQVTNNKDEIDTFKKSIGDKISRITADIKDINNRLDKKYIPDSSSESNSLTSDEDSFFQLTSDGALYITVAKNITLEASHYNVCIIDKDTKKPLNHLVDEGVMSGADRKAKLGIKENGVEYFSNVESLHVKLTDTGSTNKEQVNADSRSELVIPLVRKGKA